jgi:glycosyltransferase involved in cell wall biosynthesis
MVVNLAVEAKRHGVDSHVIAYAEDGPLRATLERAHVGVTVLPWNGQLSWELGVLIAKACRESRADVLHSHHLGPFIYGAVATALVTIPQVHTEHSHELYDSLPRRFAGRLMSSLSQLVACSEEVARFHETRLKTEPRVIANGVRIPGRPGPAARKAARRIVSVHATAPVVGCVARLAPEKGHRLLVDAFAKLRSEHPDAALVLIGDGQERERIERQADALGVRSSVRMLGERDDVEQLLPAFDVFALASDREGLPLAVLEAMASSVPFVSTDVGELPRLAEMGAGRVVELTGGAEALSRELAAELRGRTLADRGARAREVAEERFSIEAMTRSYVELYRHEARRKP